MLRRRVFAGLFAVVLAGCGGGGGSDDLVLPSRPTTPSVPATTIGATTTTAAATATTANTTPVVPPAPWAPATMNLAGLPSECGTIGIVVSHPGQGNVIAGVALHGLWSLDAGATEWTALGTGGGDPIIGRPNGVTFDPDDPRRFWEASIYGAAAVFGTDDAGATFRQLGDIVHMDAVSVDFSDPARQTMIAGQHEGSVVYRSTNGGETWTDVSESLGNVGHAFAPLVLDARTYLLGTKGSSNGGVFRTTDGGDSWTRVHEGLVSSQPLVSPDGKIQWVLESGGMIVSTDQGATWTVLQSRIGGSLSLVQLPDGRLAGLGGDHVVVSEDGGVSWTAIGSQLPYSPLGLAYSSGHKAFFIWRLDCGTGSVPVGADNIMSSAFDGG